MTEGQPLPNKVPDWDIEGPEIVEVRTCGECGHFDNCQMFCGLDFGDASEDMECRFNLESELE